MSSLFNLPFVTSGAGYKLYFYQTGTSTPQNTYQDAELTTPHANPVVADASGNFDPIFLDPSLPDYRVTLTNSADVIQAGYPVDDVAASTASVSGLFAVKASSTTKTSTTTLTADTELTLSLPTAGKYLVELGLHVDKGAGTGAGGFAMDLGYSGSLSATGALMAGSSNLGAADDLMGYTDLYASSYTIATITNTGAVMWRGIVHATSAGTLSLEWAQNSSSVQPTILRIGSYIKAERVA